MLFELKRISSNDEGTLGILYTVNFSLSVIELPWKDNLADFSCIPSGTYHVVPYNSPTFGDVYLILGVLDRENILFHKMNWAGDIRKGFKSDSEGCIGVGLYHDKLQGQIAVIKSEIAMKRMKTFVGKQEFDLRIEDWYKQTAIPVMNVL